MYLVPAGRFIFGDSKDKDSPNPRQELELAEFYLDATEVPSEIYSTFARATNRRVPTSENPTLPVTDVTFDEAAGFCQWAGKRLPTEKEWEKAARGDTGRIYPWSDLPMDNPGKLVPVDEYPDRKASYGHLGMSGNVYEWTNQVFPVDERYMADMAKLFPGQPVSQEWFCTKGGSFLQEDERFLRLYMRRGWPRNRGAPTIGFRCARDAVNEDMTYEASGAVEKK
jgi:formylglycine-generating enzyme required for sulfatase activity